MTQPAPSRASRRLLFAAVFASGLAGLMHEIVWSKMLVTLIGSTAHAQVAVLAVFMIGLAIGSFVFGKRTDLRARPLVTYARLEFLIAGYGLLLPAVLAAAGSGYEALARRFFEQSGPLFALRFTLSLLCLLLPAIWMGGTLPILARFLVDRVESTRGAVARLYALNNLGAVLGVGIAGFWTLSSFGILPTLVAASVANLLAGIIALKAEARSTASGPADAVAAAPVPTAAPRASSVVPREQYSGVQYAATLVALLASGAAAMGYEVLFTRVIALAFGSSTHSFTVMLMSFVTGIGIGSAIVARLRVERPLWLFGTTQVAAAIALVVVTPLISRVPYWIGLLRIDLGTGGAAFTLYQFGKAGLMLLFLLVPTVCIGFGFPLVSQIQARSPARIGLAVGSSYAWNTIGNVFGTVATGLWLLPAFGVLGSFHVHLALNLAAGLLVLAVAGEVPLVRRALPVAAGAGAFFLYLSLGTGWIDPINRSVDHLRMHDGPDPNAPPYVRAIHPATSFEAWKNHYLRLPENFPYYHFREDANATVLTFGNEEGLILTVNSKPDASSVIDPEKSDLSTQLLLAHLPLFFARDRKAVLVIGHGSGITAGSAMVHGAERGDIVEISRGVIESDALFADANHQVLSNPRVRVWLEDGRTFMRTAPWDYDVIISQPSNPWIAGISGLFTRECFQEARAALRPGGVLCVWFHEYEQSDESMQLVLRTVADVFPHATVFQVLLDGDVVVLASESPLEPDFARMEALFDRPEVRGDIARMRVFNLATLLVFHAIPESAFRAVAGPGPVNTDGHQRLDSIAAKAYFEHQDSTLVWRNHCLNKSSRSQGEGLLDRYIRWRASQGDPVCKEELETVLRRVRTNLDPVAIQSLETRALAASPRAVPTQLASRGAVPEFTTVGYGEANDRGADLHLAGDGDGAIRLWRHATKLDPKKAIAYSNLGAGLLQKGDVPEAIRAVEEGIAEQPQSAFLKLVAAQLHEAAGNRPRSQALLEEAARLDPENVEVLTRLGEIYRQTNQAEPAARVYERLLQLDPANADYSTMLAQIHMLLPGGRQRAMQVLYAALAIHPDEPELARLLQIVQSRP